MENIEEKEYSCCWPIGPEEGMRPLATLAGIAAVLAMPVGSAPALAGLKPLKPGQYQIGANPQIQQICLKGDGTWYGTTFNFGGHWNDITANVSPTLAAIYGQYSIHLH